MSLPLVAALLLAATEAPTPRVADERIVLRTIAGDIVLALYPDVAPQHTEQMLRLAKLGVFDTTHFFRIEPNYIIQLSSHYERTLPLTEEQKNAIHRIKAEFSQLHHRRGTLSMAHADGDDDSAETSWDIVLADSESVEDALDRKYTIFGHVEQGMDVVDSLTRVPLTKSKSPVGGSIRENRPMKRLTVYKAEVMTGEQLKTAHLQPAMPLVLTEEELHPGSTMPSNFAETARQGGIFVLTSLGLMLTVSLVGFFLAPRVPPRVLASILLINMMIGGFLVFVLLFPKMPGDAPSQQYLGAALFFGLLAMLKLMGRFESPA